MSIKHLLWAGACALALGLALPASADPIQDLSVKTYAAGWFPNYFNGRGPLTCPRACKAWIEGVAEGERATKLVETAEHAYVCKVTTDPAIVQKPINDPSSHWIYGSQYDDLPVCYATRKFGGGWMSREFMCLCLENCRKPNLVVSQIHRPTWDGSQSVIEVDITNTGGSAAAASTAELVDYDFAPGVASVAVPAIPAGGTVTVVFTLPYWVYNPDASLIVTADSKGEIDECNENDNRLRFFELG
jgi:CARDB